MLIAAAWAQAPSKPQPAAPSSNTEQAAPPKGPGTQPQPAPAQATPEHRITPEEARELLHAVDEVLKFDSGDTGLRIKHDVKRQLADREQVQAYIEARLKEDEDTQRLRRSEVVLKKLGLLPRDFDLQTFLVELLREQVAGYYDTKTRTVYLLDWLPPASQLTVMAHELTHALQDQNFGLEKWVGKGTSEKTPTEEARGDEEIAARHAVVEGQAMAVMIDYLLAPTGNSVLNSPAITQAIQQGMMESDDSPVFNRAPLFLKRVLLFPYRDGLNFERELLVKGGKDKAFAGVFKSPPQNTRQVMEPATYLAGEKLPEMPVADLHKLMGKDWEKYDVGSIGEFDVAVMAEIYSGADVAKKISPQWRGGWYYAVKRKNGGELALVMVTRWANAQSATDFAKIYEATFEKRYKHIGGSGVGGGCPGCKSTAPLFSGSWLETTEGRVAVERNSDMVIAIESVPAEMVEKVRQAVLGK
ncbi:MAG TPA: hypothetical protein VF840_08185 [Terriglobales bacterium]